MKRIILSIAFLVSTISIQIMAQARFEVNDFGEFKLHSYVTADPLNDMSYIIESKKGLVILEPAVFWDNIKEFNDYINKLNKPVKKVIVDYHVAGFSAFDQSKFVMIEGMPEFVKGEVYSNMMSNFSKIFEDKMDIHDNISVKTVDINGTKKWIGITFDFSPGPSSDFPAASILIGGNVYYTHFVPVLNMHMSPLQISSHEAIDATVAELEQAKISGATIFIGGHGISTANIDAVNFQIDYLKKMKETALQIKTADEFVLVMMMTYRNIAGEDNLIEIANNLYK